LIEVTYDGSVVLIIRVVGVWLIKVTVRYFTAG